MKQNDIQFIKFIQVCFPEQFAISDVKQAFKAIQNCSSNFGNELHMIKEILIHKNLDANKHIKVKIIYDDDSRETILIDVYNRQWVYLDLVHSMEWNPIQ